MTIRRRRVAGPRRHVLVRAAVVAAAVLLAACSDDGSGGSEQATSTSADSTSSTTATGPAMSEPSVVEDLLITASDLPPGFEPTDEADDTVTSFCAAEDAAGGLSATWRAVAGFIRDPEGASVVQVVISFEDGGAATFVQQADAILERCSSVPDVSGLAFDYEPLTPSVAATLEGADASAGGYGVSVGSGSLTVEIAAFHHGAIGQLVAVLGVDTPRAELDALAASAFSTAVAKADEALASGQP